MRKIPDNRAWWLVLPVLLLVAFSALVPLMTVVNYSVQDIFGPGNAYYVGTEWFRDVLRDERLQASLLRQFGFSGAVLAIQIPLGIGVALMMPRQGIRASLCLILLAILALAAHAWIGLWAVLTDYITDRLMGPKATALRVLLQVGMIVVTVIYVVWAINILWGT